MAVKALVVPFCNNLQPMTLRKFELEMLNAVAPEIAQFNILQLLMRQLVDWERLMPLDWHEVVTIRSRVMRSLFDVIEMPLPVPLVTIAFCTEQFSPC